MSDRQSGEVLRASCSCGKEWERPADESNLPRENNVRILNGAIGAHEFTHEWKGEEFEITRRWSA